MRRFRVRAPAASERGRGRRDALRARRAGAPHGRAGRRRRHAAGGYPVGAAARAAGRRRGGGAVLAAHVAPVRLLQPVVALEAHEDLDDGFELLVDAVVDSVLAGHLLHVAGDVTDLIDLYSREAGCVSSRRMVS